MISTGVGQCDGMSTIQTDTMLLLRYLFPAASITSWRGWDEECGWERDCSALLGSNPGKAWHPKATTTGCSDREPSHKRPTKQKATPRTSIRTPRRGTEHISDIPDRHTHPKTHPKSSPHARTTSVRIVHLYLNIIEQQSAYPTRLNSLAERL